MLILSRVFTSFASSLNTGGLFVIIAISYMFSKILFRAVFISLMLFLSIDFMVNP